MERIEQLLKRLVLIHILLDEVHAVEITQNSENCFNFHIRKIYMTNDNRKQTDRIVLPY